jgi:hypothetical protein
MGIDAIRALVDRFETHRVAYTSGQYNETQLRQEFLNPFFKAPGGMLISKGVTHVRV